MNTEERHAILSQERGSAQGHAYRLGYLPSVLAGEEDGAEYRMRDRSPAESLGRNHCPVAGSQCPPREPENPRQHGPAAAKLGALGLTTLVCQHTNTFLGKTRRRWTTILEAFSTEDVVIHMHLSSTLPMQRNLQGEHQVLLTALLRTLVYGMLHIACMSSACRKSRAAS